MESSPRISPAWRLGLSGWFSLLALGLAFWLVISYAGLILEVLFILFAAALLGLAIRPLADALARWRVPRGLTVLGAYVGLLVLLVQLGTMLAPMISAEVARLQANGPALLQSALARLTALPLLGQNTPSIDALVQNLTQRLDTVLSALVGAAAGVVTEVGGLMLDTLAVLILAYFFATDADLSRRLLLSWIPPHQRPRARAVLARLRHDLARWVWAQTAIAVYFALAFGLGLTMLGVPFALTIGLAGGVLEVIPYLGGVVAVCLAGLSALTVNPWLALWVAVLYAVVTEVESHLIAPIFYGRAMGLRPSVVLVALLVGAKVKGVLGVFFAVPVAVVLAALLHEVRLALIPAEPEPEPDNSRPAAPVPVQAGERS